MKRVRHWLPFLLSFLILAGCGETPTPGGAPTPIPTPSWTIAPGHLVRRVVANPDQYLGQEITVEGVVEAKGSGFDTRFYLRGNDGDLLEVSPWVPLDVVQPPDGSEPKAKSMAYYIGRRVRLTGVVEKGHDGIILQVSFWEEL